MECNICWDDLDSSFTVLRCCPVRYYHKECINRWFLTSRSCPFCRFDYGINTAISVYSPPQTVQSFDRPPENESELIFKIVCAFLTFSSSVASLYLLICYS